MGYTTLGGGQLEGVCTYGIPIGKDLVSHAFNGKYQDCFLELNRLCVNEGLPKNALSFFVGQTLLALPKPMVVVSYADSGQNHHGYIYQATNWIYTGLSVARKDLKIKGYENQHSRTLTGWDLSGYKGKTTKEKLQDKFGEDNVYFVERSRKHRYFYLCGDKRQKREMMKNLKFPICPYPKGDNVRYDASYECTKQGCLF